MKTQLDEINKLLKELCDELNNDNCNYEIVLDETNVTMLGHPTTHKKYSLDVILTNRLSETLTK